MNKLSDPHAKSIAIHRLFVMPEAPHKTEAANDLLRQATESSHEDYSRYAATVLLRDWAWKSPTWKPGPAANPAVKLLLAAIGLRARRPTRRGVLDVYFKERIKIAVPFPWRKAMGNDWREAERRCIRVQELASGDPTGYVTMVDTFNELLLQRMSARHPTTATAFVKAAGKNAQPDLGNWLHNPILAAVLPKGLKWYQSLHKARAEGDLAHAKTKKGIYTRPLSFRRRDRLMNGAQQAWAELMLEWKKIL